jgi:fructose-1,6-bisphosphatase/inositol monophosphatase family enzyme
MAACDCKESVSMVNNYDEALEFAKKLAIEARNIALKYYKTDLVFETKSDASPVTVADKQVNQLVVSGVQEHFPEDGVLGEEQSWHEERSRLWVCDPIDGTIAFSMGEPAFMFSLALVENGKPIVAVTCDLANGDLFWATKGGGSFLNDKPVKVSSRQLKSAWLAFPTNLKWLYSYQSKYSTNAWDMAAVKLIVDEAGGKMTNIAGQEHRYDENLTGGIIISNGVVHEPILEIMNDTK